MAVVGGVYRVCVRVRVPLLSLLLLFLSIDRHIRPVNGWIGRIAITVVDPRSSELAIHWECIFVLGFCAKRSTLVFV